MSSTRVLILAEANEVIQDLIYKLNHKDFTAEIASSEEDVARSGAADFLLIEDNDTLSGYELTDTIQRIKQDRQVFVIVLTDKEKLRDIENNLNIDDFILRPYHIDELALRMARLLQKSSPKEESAEILKIGDLVIDLPRCEVWVSGKVVDLTFTEYELLKLLVSQKGQVVTREAALNKIWGYDYFGGDRTVDVHITRLRSKIEDSFHSFIETVRNIGYRIKTNDN